MDKTSPEGNRRFTPSEIASMSSARDDVLAALRAASLSDAIREDVVADLICEVAKEDILPRAQGAFDRRAMAIEVTYRYLTRFRPNRAA